MVDCHEIRSGGECAFDLDRGQCRDDGGQDVAATEHRSPNLHKVGDGVVAIADELGGLVSIRCTGS